MTTGEIAIFALQGFVLYALWYLRQEVKERPIQLTLHLVTKTPLIVESHSFSEESVQKIH